MQKSSIECLYMNKPQGLCVIVLCKFDGTQN